MENYKDIERLLAPRVEAKASDRLRSRISAVEPKRKRRLWPFGFAATIAAAAMICGIIFIPAANAKVSVKELLQDAIALLGENFTIEMEARTTPTENFEFYDPKLPPIPLTMTVNGREWRIDKGGRAACGNDTVTHAWTVKSIGHRTRHSGGMMESFCYLLNPRYMLEAELATQKPKTKIEEKGDRILLKITDESSLIRHFTFDAATHRLLDFSILVNAKGKKVTVLRTTKITYGGAVVNMSVPTDIQWVDIDSVQGIFGDKTPEQAAREILSAFEPWDTTVLAPAFAYYNYEQLRGEYGGARLVRIGRAFKKRGYGDHQFVPYEILLRNGTPKKFNISLVRTDSGAWVVDGGI